MWLRSWSSISTSSSSSVSCCPFSKISTNHHNSFSANKPISLSNPRVSLNTSIRAQLSDQIIEVVHNKVLIAAGVSAAIGQLSKPFTSVILYGKEFDIKSIIQAGGFPSTHSSAVVAAATSLGLERGFSDSIFGITVVYACLIMYDAQGVRREVGIHARTLNKFIKANTRTSPIDAFKSQPGSLSSSSNRLSEDSSSSTSKAINNTVLVSKPAQVQVLSGSNGEPGKRFEEENSNYTSLKESIGHTEVEVIAGALLGFLVSLAVNTLV